MRDKTSESDKIFVRKITRDFYPISEKDIENESKAIDRLCKRGHQRIITVYGNSWMPAPYSRFYAIDMDYCQISLHEYIYATERWKISNPLPLAEHPGTVFGIMMHISEGLAFIHENRYIHRNLVPRNILFNKSSKSWVITEFSISSEIRTNGSQSIVDSRGTPGYRAPELLNPGVYNEKVDIWALGCILYELVKQLPIFDSDSAVYDYSQHPESLGEIPFGGELVGLMLQIEPDKRPSASEIHTRLSELYKNAGDMINWPVELVEGDLFGLEPSGLDILLYNIVPKSIRRWHYPVAIKTTTEILENGKMMLMMRTMLEYVSLSQLAWSRYRYMIDDVRKYVILLDEQLQRGEAAIVPPLTSSTPMLFTSLVRLYPELSILRIALAATYLINKDIPHALVALKELEGIPDLSRAQRENVHRVVGDLERESDIRLLVERGITSRYVSSNRVELQEYFLQFPWNLPNIFASEKELATELPNFVALTVMKVDRGVRKQVMDMSVTVDHIRDFVAEQWGVIGSTVLDALQSILIRILELKGPGSVKEGPIQLPFGNCAITATTTAVEILALCFDESWNHLVFCLVWISDVLGQPPNGGLVVRGQPQLKHSSVDIGSQAFSLSDRDLLRKDLRNRYSSAPLTQYNILATTITRLEEDQEIKNVSLTLFRERSCWTHLFDRAYIGCCTVHMIPEVNLEHWQCGMRMTFELMTSLAGIQKVVVHEGGIVLVGVGVALVPKRIVDPRTRSVQWHLIERDTPEQPPISLFDHDRFWKDALKTDAMKIRIMETDLDNLRGVAFLGWNPDDVYISWNPQVFGGFQPTPLSPATSYWVHSGSATQYGFQVGPSFFSGGFQRVRNRGRVCAAVRNSSPRQFEDKIESLYNGTVVIFDASERKIGWLCSTIDLMVLLMRFHLRRKRYSDPINQDSRWARPIEESIDRLRSLNLDDSRIREDDPTTYGDLLEQFCAQYEHVFGSLRQHQRRGYDEILGWDIFDLLTPTISGRILPKSLPAEGGIKSWSSLIGTEDVIFVNGISNLICAPESHAICQFIRQYIPPRVLFCPLYLLRRLLLKYACHVTRTHVENHDYEWVYRGTPYQCPDEHCPEGCWKTRLQKAKAKTLVYHVTGRYIPSENTTGFYPDSDHGAICFGRL